MELEAGGWRVTRRGGPDLWAWDENGRLCAVKVRVRRAKRRERGRLLAELRRLGIPVLVWAADDPVLRR